MGGHLLRSGAPRGGRCWPACGPEAACRHFPNSSALCVCVHDASPAVPGRKCPRVAIPVSLRSIPVIVPTNGTNGSLWRTSVQQAPAELPAEPSAPPWAPGGSLQTAAAAAAAVAVSLLLVALLLSSAVSRLWRCLLAARPTTAHAGSPQHLPLTEGEDSPGGAEQRQCLLEAGLDRRQPPPRPAAPAPAPT